AESLLQYSPEGTFLIRFSDSQQGWLAISFAAEGGSKEGATADHHNRKRIQHCLVEVQADGCSIVFSKGHRRKFSSLKRLIYECSVLKAFY
ncbi:unnamed protein product, partial [Heterosigma akashiwo]